MKTMNLNKGYGQHKKYSILFIFIYCLPFLLGIKTLFHGFPDIERFFAEWMDERLTLTIIMKFGTLNFAPTEIWHPPLYHYLTFIPIAAFFLIGKAIGFFHDKVDFIRFYFNNTHYFFFIGRLMSYLFYWLAALVIYRISRLFYNRIVSHIAVLSYLLIPEFIFDFSVTRSETLLFLNTSICLYFFLKHYLYDDKKNLLISAFFLGVSAATKYNAIFLGAIYIPLLIFRLTAQKDYKEFFLSGVKVFTLAFLGFFICDPFFIIQFSKYFHNFMVYSMVEAKYYWANYYPAIFMVTHIKTLASLAYLNIFGFLILIFGAWSLFKKDKKLAVIIFSASLVYEVYFGIFQNNCSPLRYLNPALPIVALVFASGVDFVIMRKRKFIPVLILFLPVLFFNYFDIRQGLSFGPTFLQEARYFIEKSVPSLTTICITSDHYLPQLNMTRESYYYLTSTKREWGNMEGHKLTYKDMDDENSYDSIFKELRIKSLTKEPQYNLVRWSGVIKTESEALDFIKRNNIKYIIGISMPMVGDKNLADMPVVSLVKEFRPKNKKIYNIGSLCLYRVN